jgi:hypothetical protein
VSEGVSELGEGQVSGIEYEVWYRKTLIPDWSVSSPIFSRPEWCAYNLVLRSSICKEGRPS